MIIENKIVECAQAQVSSMYYDFEPGKAFYRSPSGRINGELGLKSEISEFLKL